MSIQQKVAAVFGGTGFIGRAIVRELALNGYTVRVISRNSASAYFLKPLGSVGQIVPMGYDPSTPDSLIPCVTGADVVIYSVGILFERGRNRFNRIHAELPGTIAKASQAAKVKRFVYVSALNIDTMTSQYAQSKLAGEVAVRNAFPDATFLRPSVVFGPDDAFFNKLAGLAKNLPALPLLRAGKTKFQPVYVGDVAKATLKALDYTGQCFDIAGPDIITFRQIYQRIMTYTGINRPLVDLPQAVAFLQAMLFEHLPNPPFTRDQLVSLETDSILTDGKDGLQTLGITKTALETIVPLYLARFRTGGPFAEAA